MTQIGQPAICGNYNQHFWPPYNLGEGGCFCGKIERRLKKCGTCGHEEFQEWEAGNAPAESGEAPCFNAQEKRIWDAAIWVVMSTSIHENGNSTPELNVYQLLNRIELRLKEERDLVLVAVEGD